MSWRDEIHNGLSSAAAQGVDFREVMDFLANALDPNEFTGGVVNQINGNVTGQVTQISGDHHGIIDMSG